MEIKPGLHRMGRFDPADLHLQLADAGYTTFELAGSKIVDRSSFFSAVRATFPLDPPLIGSDSWDALNDSLWGGLFVHPATRIAIIWSDTHPMEALSPSEFEIAIAILSDIALTIGEPRFTNGRPKDLTVLLS